MHWGGDQTRLTPEQVALHKSHLARQSEAELEHSYAVYLRALALKEGEPPAASTLQYFVETWREMRRRKSRGCKRRLYREAGL